MSKPMVLSSSIEQVVVYRRGALVTREATLDAGELPLDLALDGLPLAMDDESVRVTLEGEGVLPRPSDVRAELFLPPSEEEAEASPEEIKRCERRASELRRRLARVEKELERLGRIGLQLAPCNKGQEPKPVPAAAWTGLIAWRTSQRAERVQERTQLNEELRQVEEEAAGLRQNEAMTRARRDARADAVRKRVVLRLRGERTVAGPARLRLQYRVPGARWVPTYVLRMARDGESAELGIRAHVVQASGEAWTRVRLALSTANLERDTKLPELRSLRIGRRQPPAPSKGWREPPTGAGVLFEGIDRALKQRPGSPPPPPPKPKPMPAPEPAYMESTLDDVYGDYEECEAAADMDDFGGAVSKSMAAPEMDRMMDMPPPAPMAMAMPAGAPPPGAAPLRAQAKESKKRGRRSMAKGRAGGGGMAASVAPEPEPAGLEPEQGLLRYGNLILGGWDTSHRGKLRPKTLDDVLGDLDARQRQTVGRRLSSARSRASEAWGVALPTNTQAVESSCGSYDYRYDAEGRVDVPCDGALHNVPLYARRADAKATVVVVPRESDQAVREARMTNPLEAPLLAGPTEVYLEDEFLVATRLATVPAGGEIRVGLGVEEAFKVARNSHLKEESFGLLGGGRALLHQVEVEVASRLSTPVEVEVRERVPLPADDDAGVEVTDETATPPWEVWHQAETRRIEGGRRWLLELAPGEERKLTFSYTLKIDGKDEIVGGDRRE